MLGLAGALYEWWFHLGGDQKARSRRRQRARENSRFRRRPDDD